MYFTEHFEVSPLTLNQYGAININLTADRPLFIDPLLIFHKSKYDDWYMTIVKYLEFLFNKSFNKDDEKIRKNNIKTYFTFKEVCQNWLGYSLKGNKGRGKNERFGTELFDKIHHIFSNRDITKSVHMEKIVFFSDNIGKDTISDFTTNIIKGHLCEYTQNFAINNIDSKYLKHFQVDKTDFDYASETFTTKQYLLPFIINDGKVEYVLLTPNDIVRQDDPAISKVDMYNIREVLLESLDNDTLKTQINSYIDTLLNKAIEKYKKQNKTEPSISIIEKLKKIYFIESINEYPEIRDYYIKFKEETALHDSEIAFKEFEENDILFVTNALKLDNLIKKENKTTVTDEAVFRICEFRRIIEKCGGYKLLYANNQPIHSEDVLQRLFKFAQVRTEFAFYSEVNNGTGPSDFIYSDGEHSQIVEFKLASNTKLKNVWAQVKSYEDATVNSLKSIIVVFYFNDDEYSRVMDIIDAKNRLEDLEKTIFLVDCSNKKVSASNEK